MTDNTDDEPVIETWWQIRKRHQREREELVLRAIEVAGSKAGAAKLLGMGQAQIYRLIP